MLQSPRMANRAKDQSNTIHNNNTEVFTTYTYTYKQKYRADAGDTHGEGNRMKRTKKFANTFHGHQVTLVSLDVCVRAA